MGEKFLNGPVSTTRAGRITGKRDFAPDSPEIKFSDRREALELMTQIESTVTSLHREAEAQFRPELEKIVSGIETGFRGTALYATENIAGRINARTGG